MLITFPIRDDESDTSYDHVNSNAILGYNISTFEANTVHNLIQDSD